MLKINYTFNYNEELSPTQRADFMLFLDGIYRYGERKLKGIWLEEVDSRTLHVMYATNESEIKNERKSVYIRFENQPVTENPKINYNRQGYKGIPLFVVYLFNFTSYQQLQKSLIYLLRTQLSFREPNNSAYYELTTKGVRTIKYTDTYEFNSYLKGYDFELGRMASREQTEDVRVFTNRLAQKVNAIDGLQVTEVIHSNESEACYLHISHYLVPARKMKISIRNHPLNTQSQMVYYLYNFDSYEKLEDRMLEVLDAFDWDDYNYSAYNYYDVTDDAITCKKVGEDLKLYSPEQLAYVESMRKERNQSKPSKALILHPNEFGDSRDKPKFKTMNKRPRKSKNNRR